MAGNSNWRSGTWEGQPEVVRQGVRRNAPRLVDRVYFWKPVMVLTACIMGVLTVLSAALVLILTRLYPY